MDGDRYRHAIDFQLNVLCQHCHLAQTQEIGSSTHYMGQSELTAHFGLGAGPFEAVDVVVHWPRLRVAVHYLHVERNIMLRAVPPVERYTDGDGVKE